MSPATNGESSYWYSSVKTAAAVEVLQALRCFRAADSHMRHRLTAEMDMNETDLAALRVLLAAEKDGRSVSPKALSRELGITTAAMAKLLARMAESGHIRRVKNPCDGRAQLLFATPKAHHEVRQQLGDMHQRMVAAAAELDPGEQATIVRFLSRMSAAVNPTETED